MNEEPMKPIEAFLEMDAGIFADKIGQAISDVGRAAVSFGEPAKLTIELTFKQLSTSRQCDVTHKIRTETPHSTGKTIDHDQKSTPMYIHSDGKVSIFAEEQKAFDFNPNATAAE